ncbi:hypothetical protein EDB81DRAFT_924761 [Dactylonectria macrodidyma]|uniref:Uncharacterized protein n=1 Tax=Dactylonectria macrodidyma TaxID=307937 RepID=A0A9P9JH59_9HYPO|nr:hypothetical protein EDB81DRAFT_924761 [Dactylonectria macrodidyma]
MGSSAPVVEFLASLRTLLAETAAKKRATERDEFASLRGSLIKFIVQCSTTLRATQARANCTLQFTDGTLPTTDLQAPPYKIKVYRETYDQLEKASSGDEFIETLQTAIGKQVPRHGRIRLTKTRRQVQMTKKNTTEPEPKIEPQIVAKINPKVEQVEPKFEQSELKIELPTLTYAKPETTTKEIQSDVPTESPKTTMSEKPIELDLEARIIDNMATQGDAEWVAYKKSLLALAFPDSLVVSSVAERIMTTFKFLKNKSLFTEPTDWQSHLEYLISQDARLPLEHQDIDQRLKTIVRICYFSEAAISQGNGWSSTTDWERRRVAVRTCGILAEVTAPVDEAYFSVCDTTAWVANVLNQFAFIELMEGPKVRVYGLHEDFALVDE